MKNKKEKVLVVIDGSNFYHILKHPEVNIKGTLRYNYRGLIEWLLNGREAVSVRYYVGLAKFDPIVPEKSQQLVSNQQRLFAALGKQDIEIMRGYMMKNGTTYHEKGVDVKLAIDMVVGAYENFFDTVILISSDTDIIPAVEKVIARKKRVEYIGLSYRPSFGLMKKVSETRLLTKSDLEKFVR
jgi:uncharacterized LabA/DUF88 family protein